MPTSSFPSGMTALGEERTFKTLDATKQDTAVCCQDVPEPEHR
jgi:hypothetical protein